MRPANERSTLSVLQQVEIVSLVVGAVLQSTSVMMMIGGAVFFGVAVLLSVYRDWLLGLPEKVRNGDGLFNVFRWR